jgi:putative IMPACT (imprinted ancient) family translation regulator
MAAGARFRTLAGPVEGELRDRGSRFLARARPVAGRHEAEAFFAAEAQAFRDATHVVPAFRLHDGTAFASDAGEPAGSAGPPLLTAIQGAGLHDVAAVVVRWYGGTNLGVGGLVRAYRGALALALQDAGTREAVPALRLEVRFAYPRTAAVLRAVQAHGGEQQEHGYEAAGSVLRFLLPAERRTALDEALRDATQGEVSAVELGGGVLFRATD